MHLILIFSESDNSLEIPVIIGIREVKIGDSLRRKIDKGIAKSNFGVIVISRDFINKGWTNYEIDGLITRAVNGEQTMLPIWHNITKRELIDYSPSLADKLARSTTDFTVEEIADEITDQICEKKVASIILNLTYSIKIKIAVM